MKYQQPTFTLPTTTRKMTQTDYEIAVGLRRPNGRWVRRQKQTACEHDPCGLSETCDVPGCVRYEIGE